MSTFQQQLIKLGHTNPELRAHIRPILTAAANVSSDLAGEALKLTKQADSKFEAILKSYLKKLPRDYKVMDTYIYYTMQKTRMVHGDQVGYSFDLAADASYDEVAGTLKQAGFDGVNNQKMLLVDKGNGKWEVSSVAFAKMSK